MSDISKIINTKSLSFESIKNDILKYMDSLPDGQSWKDYYINTSDGNILLSLFAGVSSFKVFNELSRIRESSLDYATIDTNVFNLAANKGYLITPSFAPEFTLSLKLNSTATSEIVFKEGDMIASLGNYFFYALEPKTITSYLTAQPIKCVYGYKNNFNQDISGLKKNTTFTFNTRDKYIGSQLENLYVDNTNITLSSDSSIYSNNLLFILRRILFYTSKLYFGNGTIGFYNSNSKQLVYTCISYDTDILENIDNLPTLITSDLILDAKVLTLNPSFDPDINQVRNIARYYPIDGRIVRDDDYKSTILKYFNSYLYDVLSYNSDPDQELTLLIKNNFTSEVQTRILDLCNKRMALGINVNIYTKTTQDGKDFSFTCGIASSDYYQTLYTEINDFLNTKKYTFLKTDQVLTTVNMCIELSAKFGIKFTPNDSNTISLLKNDFLKSLNATIQLIS